MPVVYRGRKPVEDVWKKMAAAQTLIADGFGLNQALEKAGLDRKTYFRYLEILKDAPTHQPRAPKNTIWASIK
jgi:hypothetical protein